MKGALKKAIKPVVMEVAGRFGPHRRSGSEPRLWVLMYHRILPEGDERFLQEEPGMVVTPESFDMHLKEVKRLFEVVRLGDWVEARAEGRPLPARACAVTFDDGWQDNYEHALPLLKKHQVPATLFAVADKIGTDFQFWPNMVAALLLSGAGPRLLEHPVLRHGGTSETAPDRERIAHSILALKAATDAEIFQALEDIDWQSLLKRPMPRALMSWPELQAMQESGLVDIGSHTCSHRRLTTSLEASALQYEIAQSRRILEDNLGKSVNLFCFPNGDYSAEALQAVEAHYDAAVTTQRGINTRSKPNAHELLRLGVHNDATNTRRRFSARLSGWM